jgi:hypothetical protein
MNKKSRITQTNTQQVQEGTHKLQISLNRLQSQKSVLEHRLKTLSNAQRKARTRTLIQMGALLTLTDLATLACIEEGDDLQFDIQSMDKAATLLGMLLTLRNHLPDNLSDQDVEAFKKIGIRRMKSQKDSLTS